MLPATFENVDELRVAKAVVVIFAIALLAAGFSFTGLICFAVKNREFQTESIFFPALVSCIIGLLTILYDFLVFTRYHWNTAALITTVVAAVGSIVYGSLLFLTQRKIGGRRGSTARKSSPQRGGTSISLVPLNHKDSETTLDPNYYNNYNRNMFPAAHTPSPHSAQSGGYDPHSVTEEEMQRQQMLMLLLQNQPPAASPNPTQSSSTFHIDWQGREDEEPPSQGYYGPQRSAFPQTAYPGPGGEARPWDGIFRAPPRVSMSTHERPRSQEHRDARRQEIERG
ncbi:uncharacterized protein RCC_04740 [Ramularia collo-cygni]|uniref:Uncharacterized protein n=1 Tax=Ramularia collo-cygni TaxID=112498 RepID=A0A2D3UX49_9PEZI|nr:uncharacterized protein RCC_04740 [Ramularia collo-cygni]CZT18895.1 uncharacterized protein RCC_04740 [Ramularia collo-cygni]